MGSADCLRQQHRELFALAKNIAPLLDAEELARNCTDVRLKLSAFLRKLRVHLALEERFVYARLVRHSDRAVVAVVTRHQQETLGLGHIATRLAEHWKLTDDAAIEEASSLFIEETKHLLAHISKRFQLEDGELYPLVDQIRTSGTLTIDSSIEPNEIPSEIPSAG